MDGGGVRCAVVLVDVRYRALHSFFLFPFGKDRPGPLAVLCLRHQPGARDRRRRLRTFSAVSSQTPLASVSQGAASPENSCQKCSRRALDPHGCSEWVVYNSATRTPSRSPRHVVIALRRHLRPPPPPAILTTSDRRPNKRQARSTTRLAPQHVRVVSVRARHDQLPERLHEHLQRHVVGQDRRALWRTAVLCDAG